LPSDEHCLLTGITDQRSSFFAGILQLVSGRGLLAKGIVEDVRPRVGACWLTGRRTRLHGAMIPDQPHND
jgi:hypothetical protein